ncbi:hypothetical protein SASPL_111263 [Salvia splendens]|uniref:Germin-like protein n=2 Tax=Salvia splendens TaxID=180675 RepID=A0A8X8Y8P4_SALSN|nr:hypothetical protein SASPL_111263 [Salvia splendens]
MSSMSILFITLAIINFMSIALAFDARPLQDFCVADLTKKAQIGGAAPCKDPERVTANDFILSGFHLPGNTSNSYGVSVTSASATTLPGLNTLGLSFLRVDLAPNGFFPPHYHPRATELVVVLKGALEIGFITSNPTYNYFTKVVRKGDVFVVPVGLVHTVRNHARRDTVAMVAFNSQNPGVTNLPNAILAAKPAVDSVYLSKAFRMDVDTVKHLQSIF